MAKAKLNAALRRVSGPIDGVVYRQVEGELILSRRPRHDERERVGAEKANNDRFADAARRAKYASPEMVERYNRRAAREHTKRFGVRMRDYLNPPRIIAVYPDLYTGQAGEPLFVIARDDFEVKSVTVIVRRADDHSLVETGLARRGRRDVFRYDTTVAVAPGTATTLEIVAHDWPQNRASWYWPPAEGERREAEIASKSFKSRRRTPAATPPPSPPSTSTAT